MTLNSANGTISGTPTAVTAMTAYTVTASTAQESKTLTLNFRTADGYRVNDLTDAHNVGPGCTTGTGTCSLRAAMEQINANTTPNVILLPSGSNIISGLGPFSATAAMDIYGDCAAGSTLDGNYASQVMTITGGSTSLNSITVQNGATSTSGGAGIKITNTGVATFTVTLNDVIIRNNVISGSSNSNGAGVNVSGNSGTHQVILNVNRSSFLGNQDNDTGSGMGGGLYFSDNNTQGNIDQTTFDSNTTNNEGAGIHYSGNALSITHSTVSNNTASLFGSGLYVSGTASGIITLTNDTFTANSQTAVIISHPDMNITNCTFTNNIRTDSNNGTVFDSDSFCGNTNFANTLFYGNYNIADASPEIFSCGGFNSLGGNMSDDVASDGGLISSDFPSSSPLLGTFQNNGGLTKTVALLSLSPGIGQALPSYCPATDQRGLPRLQDSITCDIGAYEFQR